MCYLRCTYLQLLFLTCRPKSSSMLPPPPPPPPPPPQQPSPDLSAGQPVDYKVVVCGASGHNIRNQPTFKATPVGMLVQGNIVQAVERVTNGEGVWIRLSDQCAAAHCGVSCSTAWSLAADTSQVIYLKPEMDQSELVLKEGCQGAFCFFSLQPTRNIDKMQSCKIYYFFSTNFNSKIFNHPFQ